MNLFSGLCSAETCVDKMSSQHVKFVDFCYLALQETEGMTLVWASVLRRRGLLSVR